MNIKPIITFKYCQETEFPQDLILDAPTQGPFDDYAQYIIDTYDVEMTLDDSIKYLKELGAWTFEELQDLEINIGRLLWISLLDCKASKNNTWYMGI